jgi:hypothetical protein
VEVIICVRRPKGAFVGLGSRRIGGQVEKMMFSLKTLEWMYSLVTGRTPHCDSVDVRPRARTYGQCVTRKPIFTSRPIAHVSLL